MKTNEEQRLQKNDHSDITDRYDKEAFAYTKGLKNGSAPCQFTNKEANEEEPTTYEEDFGCISYMPIRLHADKEATQRYG